MENYICPHCGKPIDDDDALLCLYCGENLERPVGTLGTIRYSAHWTTVIIVVVLFLIVGIAFFCR